MMNDFFSPKYAVSYLLGLCEMIKPPYQLWGFGKPDATCEMIARWPDKTIYKDIDELYDAFRERRPLEDWRLIVTRPNTEVDLMNIAPSRGILLVDTYLVEYKRRYKVMEENLNDDQFQSLLAGVEKKPATAQEIAAMFKTALESIAR